MPRSMMLSCAVLLAGAGLSGCAPHIDLARPDVSLPEQFEGAESEAAQAVMPDRWWERFGDRQLVELVDAALARGTDARSAYFRLREARAIRAQSLSQRLPSGSISGSATARDGAVLSGMDLLGSTASGNSQSVAFSPVWELDLFGRLGAVGDAARATYKAAAYDYLATRIAIASDVAVNLFEARGLAVQRGDAEETLRIARELAHVAALGRDHGLTAGADAARLESDVAAARAELLRIETSLRTSKRALLVLLGQATAPIDSLVVEAELADPPPVPVALPASLLVRRPDVMAAQARLEAAGSAVQVDRLALFPQFTLQANGSISRSSGVAGLVSGLWSLGAGLSLPMLDRTRLMAQLRVTEARGQLAVISYEAAVQDAFRDADTALAIVRVDRERLADLAVAEERSRFAFEAARRGYSIGLTDITTLLQSERSWRSARRVLTDSRTQALTNVVSAFRGLGGGWDSGPQASAPGQPAINLPTQTKDIP